MKLITEMNEDIKITEEINEGKSSYRRLSLVSGLLLIAIVGEQMTYWLAQVISINDDFLARFTVEWSLWNPSTLSWLVPVLVPVRVPVPGLKHIFSYQ